MSEPYLIDNGYYIHYHQKNIGNLSKASIENVEAYVQGHLDNTINQIQAKYKNLLQQSIKAANNSVDALGQVADLNENELVDEINAAIGSKLRELLQTEAYAQMHNELSKITKVDLASIADINNNSNGIQEIKDILTIIQNAVKLLEIPGVGAKQTLISILSNTLAQTKQAKTRQEIGKVLQDQITNATNQSWRITAQQVSTITKYLQNFAYVLQTNKFKTSTQKKVRPISTRGLGTLISNNLVSTGLGQKITQVSLQKAYKDTRDIITDQIRGVQVVGSQIAQKGGVTGKTDIRDNNFSFTVQGSLDEIRLRLGISNKFYATSPLVGEGEEIIIESGSGGTLKQAFEQIFPSSQHRYIFYNLMTWTQYQNYLNNFILKHRILNLFATAGGNDFSQFLFANGTLISMWDIVKYVTSDATFYASKSSENKGQPILLHIQGRDKIINQRQSWNGAKKTANHDKALLRSHKTNALINKATISAQLHINRLNIAAGI